MGLDHRAFRANPGEVPAPLHTFKDQLVNLPTGKHDQHVQAGIIRPALASGFNPEMATFPVEVQRGDRAMVVKMGGNFNGFHVSV
ncbi:MAG: hypothetical protein C3F13_18755 [Anaerolineales bacterium]|nr:MAG: hypothetical protein C3F13_18755 [Anaerolineales bacterium]